MRVKFLSFVLLMILVWGLNAAAQEDQVFYYSGGKKIYGLLNKQWIAVKFKAGKDGDKVKMQAGIADEGVQSPSNLRLFEKEGITFINIANIQESTSRLETLMTLRSNTDVEVVGEPLYLPSTEVPLILTNEFVVRFKSDVSQDQIQELNSENHVELVKKSPFVENQMVLRVTDDSRKNALEMANQYYESGLTKFSHPNFVVYTESRFVPNDPEYPNQWHLNNTGQGAGTVDADIDAQEAWNITRGDSNVLIAVIDSGVQIQHEDLQPNSFTNPGELPGDSNGDGRPGIAGVDDDGDGLVDEDSNGLEPGDPGYSNDLVNDDDENGFSDDINGWNFYNDSGNTDRGNDSRHGTCVAGLAAAAGDNNVGVSGVCPNCAILPIARGITTNDHGEAFGYAEAMGAHIITNSWGYTIGTPATDVVVNAINDAATNGRDGLGCVVFFAMTNTNVDNCNPAGPDISSLDNVIAISRSTNQDLLGNAGFGDCMDLLAPTRGGTLGLMTTDQTGTDGYNTAADGDYYDDFSGTSGSTPQVAGIAGLMLSVNSNLPRDKVQSLLEQMADRIDATNANYDPITGFSDTHGYGRANAYKATLAAVIEKALQWLRNNQEANGSWQNHVGYTAMATLAFLNAGYTEDDDIVSQGIQYLLSNVQLDGGIYNWYGNYETALSILALKATGNLDYNDEIANAANFLKSIQSDDSDDSDHSWFGGWGYGTYDKNNWSDLSNSQFSAMALDAAGIPKSDITWTRFLRFLSRVQNLNEINDMPWAGGRIDGGFTYSPHYDIWNNFSSYGGMTAAGIWGLRLSGVEVVDDRVQAALGWLEANEDLNFNSNPMWGNSNRYYYYMAFAKAMAMCFLSQDDAGAWHEGWYDNLISKIASEQEDDGYWNQSQGMWVDTFWALLALQSQQPLPTNLWMSVILASPADVLVYDKEDRVCSNDECNIPGATFEIDSQGRQIVNLSELEPGHYRFVFIGTGNGTCHLTINGHRDDKIISTEIKEFEIRNNEVLQSDVLVSSLVGALTITVENPAPPPFVPVGIDIKPQSCPNPLNTKSKGVLPLAILGSEDFDVTQVDPASILLEGVSPLRWALEDVATPIEFFQGKKDCFEDCNDFGSDGFMDLTLKFKTQELVAALKDTQDGDCLVLRITGHLREEFNSTPIVGEDVVRIQKKKEVKK